MNKRDPEAKIARILAAAIPLFARDGRAGARIDAIAAAAGMNKRMLYHYVGDKQALFAAAVEECVKRVAAGFESEAPDAEAWRVLCNAAAVDEHGDLSSMTARMKAALRADAGDAAIAMVGLDVLESLLPELLDCWLELPVNPVERRRRLRDVRLRLRSALYGGTGPKPRVRLKPD